MKTADRQKVCPNCDGRIPYEVTQCPYCFATVQSEAASQGALFKNQSIQESLTSLYAPPYKSAPPLEPEKSSPRVEEATFTAPSATESSDIQGFWPILMLTLGANLFTLGILQFFFAENGAVHLEINSSFWFLLLLISIPLFYFGLRQVKNLK